VVSQSGAGPAAARNLGAQVARGELLAFTDADCLPEPDWLAALLAALDDPRVAGARGCYHSRQPELVARFVQQEYRSKYDALAPGQPIDFVDTYSCAYRRDVFLAAGGFDGGFPAPSVEDQEFSFRLAEAGHRLVFAPGAVVAHWHDRTLGEFLRRKFWIGHWKVRLLRRHPGRALRDSHTPFSQRLQVGLVLPAVALSLAALSSARLAGPGWVLWCVFWVSTVPLLLKVARRDPAVLLVAPLALAGRALAQAGGLAAGLVHGVGGWK
jgi:GT2 family glycosyltransferase